MFRETDFNSVGRMDAISLDEMSSVSLMNRIDTKFVTTVQVLEHVLDDALDEGYRICEISGRRLMPYSSVYYDTDDLKMFTAHRNGKKTRQKVRVRTYLSDNESFLEIKRKNNRGRTKKKRIGVPTECKMNFGLHPDAAAFLEKKSWWRAEDLTPETTTDFCRFTLVNKDMTERLTIDINLGFRNFRSGREVSLGNLVIIELKQDGRVSSQMKKILLRHRVFPYRISKYCMAVTLTDPNARPGRFIEKVRYIEKITGNRFYNRSNIE
ncbi:MAG: polyphosphate polymerase domain-containing protein [Bacteroidales bacterium]|nr:polyphosphate polymerase domain-containing protein [Bacteroidales bacterium]